MATPDPISASKGAYKSWGNTPDRAQRLANANAANPNSLLYHAKKRFGVDVDFDALTPNQLKQCEADRKAWFIDFHQRGNAARKRKGGRETR